MGLPKALFRYCVSQSSFMKDGAHTAVSVATCQHCVCEISFRLALYRSSLEHIYCSALSASLIA